MIDFTKLRNLIVEKKCVSSSDYGKEDPFVGIYWENLIDIINQCDSAKWISVEEALPEEDDVYFVLVDFNGHPQPRVTDFDTKTKKWTGYTGITHWMKIPEIGGEK